MMTDFPHNEFIRHQRRNVIRNRQCISQEHLKFVRQAMANCPFKRWRKRPLMSEWYRYRSRPDETAVIAEEIGFLVVNWPRGKDPTILASDLGETPLVLPTPYDAMLFGEAKFLDLPEAGLARWIPANGKL